MNKRLLRKKTRSRSALILAGIIFCHSFSAVSMCAAEETIVPDIERGRKIAALDYLASALATPIKLLLWNRRYGSHRISSETEKSLADFIQKNNLRKVKVRLNQFAPMDEMKRLFKNKEVAWPYRILAIPTTLLTSSTGRLFAGLIFSDYFDPFTNTMHIYSDDAAIALHEAGHAKDFEKQKWKGTYALIRSLPGVDMIQEMVATQEAFDFIEIYGTDEEKIRAPRVLYPAFGTYTGGYLSFVPFGWVGALCGGHFYGWLRSKYKREELESLRWAEKHQSVLSNKKSAEGLAEPSALNESN